MPSPLAPMIKKIAEKAVNNRQFFNKLSNVLRTVKAVRIKSLMDQKYPIDPGPNQDVKRYIRVCAAETVQENYTADDLNNNPQLAEDLNQAEDTLSNLFAQLSNSLGETDERMQDVDANLNKELEELLANQEKLSQGVEYTEGNSQIVSRLADSAAQGQGAEVRGLLVDAKSAAESVVHTTRSITAETELPKPKPGAGKEETKEEEAKEKLGGHWEPTTDMEKGKPSMQWVEDAAPKAGSQAQPASLVATEAGSGGTTAAAAVNPAIAAGVVAGAAISAAEDNKQEERAATKKSHTPRLTPHGG